MSEWTNLTADEAWEKMKLLGATGEHSISWYIDQAEKKGHSDFLAGKPFTVGKWYRVSSLGHGKYAIRTI